MTDTMMPFGKYKGRALNDVKQDANYVEWLLHQDWFGMKFSTLAAFLRGETTPEAERIAAFTKARSDSRRPSLRNSKRGARKKLGSRRRQTAATETPATPPTPTETLSTITVFRRITRAVPVRAYSSCLHCGKPLTVAIGEIHPVWLVGNEIVGVACGAALSARDHQVLADLRAGRRRLAGDEVQP